MRLLRLLRVNTKPFPTFSGEQNSGQKYVYVQFNKNCHMDYKKNNSKNQGVFYTSVKWENDTEKITANSQ
jgi:hypothetical protein